MDVWTKFEEGISRHYWTETALAHLIQVTMT